MGSPSENLATSLKALKKLQDHGIIAIQSNDLSRTHRERLQKTGFIREVIKGWYIACRPDNKPGECTAWYIAYWAFCSSYLNQRFGDDWCLSPERSLSIHSGNWSIPSQLLVRSPNGSNKATDLPLGTSIFDARYQMPDSENIVIANGMRLYSLASALIACSPKYFPELHIEIKACLAAMTDASDLLRLLLEGGHSTIAGRLAGAFRDIGNNKIADEILNTMTSAGYDVREDNPFKTNEPYIFSAYISSPSVARLKLMWQEMRKPIIDNFPKPAESTVNHEDYLKKIRELYVSDAYHSLLIEGFRVDTDFIKRVRKGQWTPNDIIRDSDVIYKDTAAAHGYSLAFQSVEKSLGKIFSGKNPVEVAADDHLIWYREMFSPNISTGLLNPGEIAGYRKDQGYIRISRYIPPQYTEVRDLMTAYFELLENETECAVRIVLGHFFFLYIHPYMDGNGRLGRLLMNIMLASCNYPWIVVPFDKRDKYMAALEVASIQQDIRPLRDFLAELINDNNEY